MSNSDDITRRDFVGLTVAGIAAAAGASASAQQAVTEKTVDIKTPDGTCDAAFIHPATGAHAAVIIWPDAFGLRPAMRDMAKRLAAESGYSVLASLTCRTSCTRRTMPSVRGRSCSRSIRRRSDNNGGL